LNENKIVVNCDNPFQNIDHGFLVDPDEFKRFRDITCPTCWNQLYQQYRKSNFNVVQYYPDKRHGSGSKPTKDYL